MRNQEATYLLTENYALNIGHSIKNQAEWEHSHEP